MASGRTKQIWDTVVMGATIFAAIEIPLRLSLNYELTSYLTIADWLITALFATDMVVHFTSPYREGRRLVTDRGQIAKHYVRTWFIIDLLATIPFDLLTLGMPIPASTMRILRLLRITRVVRLLRLAEIMRTWRSKYLNPAVMRLLFFGFWVGMLAHWIACGWLAMGGVAQAADGTETYVMALYWSITTLTTVGYGDITPHGSGQMIYTMIVMMLGVGVYGYVIGNVATLLTNIDVARARHQSQVDRVNRFMLDHQVSAALRDKVGDYYHFLWETRLGRHEGDILSALPPSLRLDISLELNQKIIAKVPLFEGATDEFIREVVDALTPVVYLPGDDIIREGDVGGEMFFINDGEVVVIDAEGNMLATLTDGSFFGEMSLLLSQVRMATIRALDFCELYRLDRDDFADVLKRHPEFAARLEDVVARRLAESLDKSRDD